MNFTETLAMELVAIKRPIPHHINQLANVEVHREHVSLKYKMRDQEHMLIAPSYNYETEGPKKVYRAFANASTSKKSLRVRP